MRRKRMHGLTIVQLMLVLLVAGILGRLVVDFVIEKRCEAGLSTVSCDKEGAVAPK